MATLAYYQRSRKWIAGLSRRVAAALRPSAQQGDLWLYAVDRPGAQRLTSTGKAEAPIWSPYSQWVYYSCSRSNPARLEWRLPTSDRPQ